MTESWRLHTVQLWYKCNCTVFVEYSTITKSLKGATWTAYKSLLKKCIEIDSFLQFFSRISKPQLDLLYMRQYIPRLIDLSLQLGTLRFPHAFLSLPLVCHLKIHAVPPIINRSKKFVSAKVRRTDEAILNNKSINFSQMSWTEQWTEIDLNLQLPSRAAHYLPTSINH